MTDTVTAPIDPDWQAALAAELASDTMAVLQRFLTAEEAAGARIFPPAADRFRALELTALPDVRVVILGQDPYHDDGQAEGLCFSVPVGVRVPSSLQNVYKELASDLGAGQFTKPKHGHLAAWGRQGVLLLNTGLTVEAHKANSHKKMGWQHFTEAIIRTINKERKGVVYLLSAPHAAAPCAASAAARLLCSCDHICFRALAAICCCVQVGQARAGRGQERGPVQAPRAQVRAPVGPQRQQGIFRMQGQTQAHTSAGAESEADRGSMDSQH